MAFAPSVLLEPAEKPGPLPVRGLHLSAPARKDVDTLVSFIREGLAREGVNTLILEFNTSFDFRSLPEFADPAAPGKDEAAKIVRACREAGIELIPGFNCLGHQSWKGKNGAFLEKHPELDETPGKFPGNKDIYCRSWCPLHPRVHEVLFPLLDELARSCEAKAFHLGMDEVFILADPDCPRCRGKDPADLFAGEVKVLRDHLKEIGCRTWMWGDRFLDGKATDIGKWEGSLNGTAPAIDKVPKDIVICDWHYEKAHETPRYFAEKGFEVVACPWKKPAVAQAQIGQLLSIRSNSDPAIAARALGLVQTTWCGAPAFLKAYAAGDAAGANGAAEAARAFREVMKALREGR